MNKLHSIGIDVGGSRVKAALVSSEGETFHQIVEVSTVNQPYPAIRDQLLNISSTLSGMAENPPHRIGIGVAGLMNETRRRVIAAPNCPGVVGVDLADEIEKLSGLKVYLENDAKVMALGEGLCGAAKGLSHYIAITLGTGVGGAIVSNGELLRGWRGGGGEIGHICIDIHGPRCGCGSNGCLEAFIGLKGIERRLKHFAPELSGRGMATVSEAAANDHNGAIRLFEWIGRTLGTALAGFVNLLNPEAIIVGGGIASAGPMLFGPLRQEIEQRAFAVYTKDLKVLPAELGNWAGVVGAGSLKE